MYCRDGSEVRAFWIVIPDGENEEIRTTSVNVRFTNPRSSLNVNDANWDGVLSMMMSPCKVMFMLGSPEPSSTVSSVRVKKVSFLLVAIISDDCSSMASGSYKSIINCGCPSPDSSALDTTPPVRE